MFALDFLQRGYTPAILITIDGRPVAGSFYSRLISATVRDEAGQTSDQLTIVLDDADNAIERPADKAKIEVWLGWAETGLVRIGTYELQSVEFAGSFSGGETMTIQASAADLKAKLKGVGREHFEDKTIGEIVTTIAGRNGMTAHVDSELASIKVKYKARVDTSEIDFLTAIADEHDAVVKPMGDRLVMTKRGSGKSASGKSLPVLRIEKSDCEEWKVSPEGRARYRKVKAGWIDQKTGKRQTEEAETGLDEGPDFTVRDPLPTQEQAKKKAQAEARRLTRNTGSGSFTMAGLPEAQAEADVIAGGSFRDGIAGTWRADAVEHTFDEKGFRTTIEIKAKEDGSSSKAKKK